MEICATTLTNTRAPARSGSVTPNSIHEIVRQTAAAVVAVVSPEEKPLFPAVWDEWLDSQTGGPAPVTLPSFSGLHLDPPGELRLLSPFVITVVAEVMVEVQRQVRMPPKEDLRSAALAAAKALGATDSFGAVLAERVSSNLFDLLQSTNWRTRRAVGTASTLHVADYIAWLGTSKREKPERHEGSQGELEQRFKRTNFDLFVIASDAKTEITTKTKTAALDQLETRMLKLVPILLRHRGQPIPPQHLMECAWSAGSVSFSSLEKARNETLKQAMSKVRTTLAAAVPGFEIPSKTRHGGYCCCGKFTFCLILSKERDAWLALPG